MASTNTPPGHGTVWCLKKNGPSLRMVSGSTGPRRPVRVAVGPQPRRHLHSVPVNLPTKRVPIPLSRFAEEADYASLA